MASTTEPEPQSVIDFRKWFSSRGGYIHKDLEFKQGSSGLAAHARNTIPSDTCVVYCPFSLAITPLISKSALSTLLNHPDALDKWAERQLICTYLSLHWILGDSDSSALPTVLAHLPYINILPAANKLRTSLHFTQNELEAFRGTNLYGATFDRRRDWDAEWQECKEVVDSVNKNWAIKFTWERYLTASTHISSRAFPSTILSSTPSLQVTDSSYPVLLPGIDSINHAPGAAVSWVVAPPLSATTPDAPADTPASESAINLVLHTSTIGGGEIFNNYGPKPNSELVLGYGFALSPNPFDTIVLQIGVGGPNANQGERKKFEIGKNANGANLLWNEILVLRALNSETVETTYEDYLRGAERLADMLFQLLDKLPKVGNFVEHDGITSTSEPLEMLEYYVHGQRDILQSLLEFASEKERSAAEIALAQGIDLVFDEERVDDEDEDEGQYSDA